ncbi:SusC/RagA family TonB-linked outer membrane protein [Aestuariibaculum sp. YM273]|uniref:SusC/RagA family TonB-linked outer membrane protein n=1 Tax=Aestuariibaculum sp. YM273 TaxID=3070659 RepID=UPI0027DDBB09|nr:SusC/RagA family TonB-linked outer membrane protein [Aestuariibaculum sp. YM273]WMI64141.1 SusC/RagA family TonB-linked outer membrane protein [Aestuariibaculum sp. YM273]
MRTFIFLLCATVFSFNTNSSLAQDRVKINADKTATIDEVFEMIMDQTKYRFLYPENLFNNTPKVKLEKGNITVGKLLGNSIPKGNFSIVLSENNTIVIEKRNEVQEFIVSGKIVDAAKIPVPGASIMIKGTHLGTFTDFDGNYSLKVTSSKNILMISSLGFKTQEVLVGDRTVINITLEEDVAELDAVEIVSTGYQNISKERATGSFAVVKSEDLERIPGSNAIMKLEGQVPGLQLDILESDNTFVYSNLLPETEGNTSYNFRIRGQSTYQAEDMPLVVLDGTPTELDIRTLNPKDIETITFLKDAAAASIYGARAANGVIVINTKKGGKGKTSINYSQSYTFSTKPSLSSLPLMDATQVLDLEQELVDNFVVSDPAAATSLYSAIPISQGMEIMFQEMRGEITAEEKEIALNVLRNRGKSGYRQVEDYFLQASEATTHDLSLSGGHDDYSFFTSISFANEKTQSKQNEGKRFTLTANQDFKMFNYIDVSTSLKGSIFNYSQNGLGLSPLASTLTTFLPYNQVVDDNGNSVDYYRSYYGKTSQEFENQGYLPWEYNYLDELRNSDKSINEQNYSANIALNIPLFYGFKAVTNYSVERSYTDNPNYYSPETFYARDLINNATSINENTGELVRGIPLGGVFQTNNYINSSYTARGQLNYNNTFKGEHSIDGIAGIEFRQTRDKTNGGRLFGYNKQTQTSIDLPSTTYTNINGYSSTITYGNIRRDIRRRFLSYYGNIAYSFRNKYTLSGSARLDDYNNFGLDKKYRRTPLWSTGAKWNIYKENFLLNANFINSLNLRASYGYNGNISLTTYPFTNMSIRDTDYNLSNLPYASINAAANPYLRWEKTGIFNLGLDFTLFDYRLSGSFEYYKKKSEDLIQDFPVSEFFGLPNNNLTRNTATLESNGIDFNVNGVILKSKDFSLNSTFVLSYNKNEVTDSRYESYSNYLNGTGSTPPIKGYPLNSMFAFRSAGLDASGQTLVYDKDGEVVGPNTVLTDIEDMEFMGTRTPRYYGSFNTTLSYKKWTLFALATYKFDYVLFNPSFRPYVSRYYFYGYDLNANVANRWRQPGDEEFTDVPGALGMNGYSYSRYNFSNKRVIEGDHIRLREISLSYDMSNIFENTLVKGANLSFTARNLGLIWTKNKEGIDPDFLPYTTSQINLPPTAMYTLGLNVNF